MGTGNRDDNIVIKQLIVSFILIVILTVVTVVSLAVVPWIWRPPPKGKRKMAKIRAAPSLSVEVKSIQTYYVVTAVWTHVSTL